MKLKRSFYAGNDVVTISRALLGKVLCSHIDGITCSMIITETEAYAGENDKASHAWGGRRTRRTEPMFAAGGCAYVYLCYGIHSLFNVVTGPAGVPHAVLIRAGVAADGVTTMLERRQRRKVDKTLLHGPGTVAKALGIGTALTGTSLTGETLWIEDRDIRVAPDSVMAGPRIGVDYAAEDARRPYRFIATELLYPADGCRPSGTR